MPVRQKKNLPPTQTLKTFSNGPGVAPSRYTVEHHDPPRERPPTPPRWDTSRKVPPPPPDEKKVRAVLKEEAQRAVFSAKRISAFTKASWDSPRPAGDPTSRMGNPYFAIQWEADQPTRVRDSSFNFDTEGVVARAHTAVERRAERQSRCSSTAWNTPHGETFQPLGDVPMVPAAVRRRERPSPLDVRGDAWVPQKKADRGKLVPLASGAPVEDVIHEPGAHRYYVVRVAEGRRFTLRMRAYRGDPDLFVCNKYDRPHLERHTWKSTAAGNVEELVIEPNDPAGGAGTYYVAVFAEKPAEYRLEAEVVKPSISLPRPAVRRTSTRGASTSFARCAAHASA